MIYISHLLPDEEMKEILAQTGAGVEAIEFSVADNLDCLSRSVETYRERMKYMGASALTIHGPYLDLNPMTYDKKIQQATYERYAQAYEAAFRLGAKKIIYHTCFYPDAYLLTGWAERVSDFYESFLRDRKDIEVDMENVFDRKWEPLAETGARVSASNFRLCLDLGHSFCYSKDPIIEWTEKLAPSLGHIHVHDNLGNRDAHLGIGRGKIPWQEVFSLLREKENLTYTIECSSKEAILQSHKALLELLESGKLL